jgi:hypothetical protein
MLLPVMVMGEARFRVTLGVGTYPYANVLESRPPLGVSVRQVNWEYPIVAVAEA